MGSGAFGNTGVSGGSATDATISFSDITTNDVSTSKHGFAPKSPGDANKFLNGLGAYSTPAGGSSPVWGGITGTLSSQTDLNTALNGKQDTLVSGTNLKSINGSSLLGSGDLSISASNYLTNVASNILWCVVGGSYASGQAAIDAAVSGQTIMFGPKSGGWGDLVLPAGKKLNLVAIGADRGLIIEVKSITYSPTTGLDPNVNQIAINGLYVNQTTGTSSALIFGGTAPARLRLYQCYLNASSGSVSLISSINSGSGSSLYLERCNIDAGSSGTRTGLTNSTYTYVRYTQMSGGTKAISNTGGTLDVGNSAIECNQVNEVVNLSGGNSFFGNSSIINTATNGSGILMASPAFLSLGNTGFAVNSGTGYCLRGTGTIFYDRYIFSDVAIANPANKKVQNTLTIFQYTSTPSIVA